MDCKARALYSDKSFCHIRHQGAGTSESSLRFIFVECKEDKVRMRELPCGIDRERMRRLTQQSAKRNSKRSSLISLRKDNEVKLEEEIIVCNLRDNDRESNRRVVDCNFKATSK